MNRYSVHAREQFGAKRLRETTGFYLCITLRYEESMLNFVFGGMLGEIVCGWGIVLGVSPGQKTFTETSYN